MFHAAMAHGIHLEMDPAELKPALARHVVATTILVQYSSGQCSATQYSVVSVVVAVVVMCSAIHSNAMPLLGCYNIVVATQ
jgi:hypothetical protein